MNLSTVALYLLVLSSMELYLITIHKNPQFKLKVLLTTHVPGNLLCHVCHHMHYIIGLKQSNHSLKAVFLI